jgi:hypothetical protein
MIWFVATLACATRHAEEPEGPRFPDISAPVAPPAPEEAAPAPPSIPVVGTRNAARFRTLARDLPETEADARHHAEADLLEVLADALDDLDARYGAQAAAAERIRGHASRLVASEPTSMWHTDWTRAALLDATAALDEVAAARPDLGLLPTRLRWAREAIAGIDPAVPMLAQRGDVALAFSRLADAVAMAAEVPAAAASR